MTTGKWDFRVERPEGHDGNWRISYLLISPAGEEKRVNIEAHYAAAQSAIDEATRLAQIQAADLNGEAPRLEPANKDEVPFDKHSRF